MKTTLTSLFLSFVMVWIFSGIPLSAQSLQIDIPPSLIIVNYDRMSIGDRQGLEAGAYVARTNDGGSNWYNPAGLSRSAKSALNVAGSAYEWSHLTLEGLGEKNTGNRLGTIPTFLGAVVGDPVISSDQWRLGFSITTPISWSPGVLDATFPRQSSGGTEIVGYYSELDFSQMIPALAAGYAPGGSWHLGVSVGGSVTSLRELQQTTYRGVFSSSALFGSKNIILDGTTIGIVATAGMQYEISDQIMFGLRVVAPSVRIGGTTAISYQSSLTSGVSAEDVYFRDQEARFEYKYPAEVNAGLAFKFGDAEIEADVKYHGKVTDYAMYSSTRQSASTGIDSNGVPTVVQRPFADKMNSAREVVNVMVGGSYAFSNTFALHAGFRSDLSPVAEQNSSLFRTIDLYGGTAGVSITWLPLTGSLGFSYSTGTSDAVDVQSVTGSSVSTSLGVSTLQILLALAYAF